MSWEPKKDEREVVKPVAVVDSILTEEPKMNLKTLAEQIRFVEKRLSLLRALSNVGMSDELIALGFLRARKKYAKYGGQFRWKITTFDKVDALQKKYKVRLVGLAGYYKCVPNEALDEIEKYARAFSKVRTDVNPEIMLIVDHGGPEERKDPIVLAGSPFGKYWYVLGAWDKEIEYVDEIVYKGK